MNAVVPDASVLIKTVVIERGSEAATRLIREAPLLVAPAHVYAECANALWRRAHRRLASSDAVMARLAGIFALPMEADDLEDMTPTALSLALEFDHPVYDCYYIAAAVQNDATLATADERLYDLAQRVGLGDRAILVR
ncbi:MAG: PIN domain-containing protein [Actinobacteria bacterium]|nr:PIN domain-containing protein [Actinomycetota bacterium]